MALARQGAQGHERANQQLVRERGELVSAQGIYCPVDHQRRLHGHQGHEVGPQLVELREGPPEKRAAIKST